MGTELTQRNDQSGVLDRLPFNLTQLLGFAMGKPRNPEKALRDAIAQLRATPEFAKKAYYSIPFQNKDGSKTIVEGPSIKAATALTGCWGNNVEGAFVGEETEDYIDVSGYYFDFETGKLTIRPMRVSKTYKTQQGIVQKWRKDILDRQIAAGISKAIRNADLAGLPAGVVAAYYAEAKKIAANGGKVVEAEATDSAAMAAEWKRILDAFDSMGVVEKELEDYTSRHPGLNTPEEINAHFIGLLNAINEGQITIEEAFTVTEQAPIAEPKPGAAPKAAPSARNLPKERVISPSWAVMKSRMNGGLCSDCGKEIDKGVDIYWDGKARKAHHKVCPA